MTSENRATGQASDVTGNPGGRTGRNREDSQHMHRLRHTYASMLILLGRKIPEVSRYLGHADIAVTMKVYAHSLKPKKQDTMNDLERG